MLDSSFSPALGARAEARPCTISPTKERRTIKAKKTRYKRHRRRSHSKAEFVFAFLVIYFFRGGGERRKGQLATLAGRAYGSFPSLMAERKDSHQTPSIIRETQTTATHGRVCIYTHSTTRKGRDGLLANINTPQNVWPPII